MGNQIIKQPSGKFAIFSSNIDGFILIDATCKQIIDFFVEEEIERISKSVTDKIDSLLKGGKPYHQFTIPWEEAVKSNDENFPDSKVPKICRWNHHDRVPLIETSCGAAYRTDYVEDSAPINAKECPNCKRKIERVFDD